jgi:hypothetical protein
LKIGAAGQDDAAAGVEVGVGAGDNASEAEIGGGEVRSGADGEP